ncbi:MAG: hypothetical protein KF752_20800 [Pirellulaceae bacterium]|nr:hypothetical protein [Pirellulaceae bacterium]
MNRVGLLRASLLIAGCLTSWNTTFAQPANVMKKMFQKRGAGSTVTELQDKHGPWLILAGTFTGDTARARASAFASALQESLRVPTFILSRASETSDKMGVSELMLTDSLGKLVPKQLSIRYANHTNPQSVAVLAGEFHSKDDPQIDGILAKVRAFQPAKESEGMQGRGIAFLTRNPMLPDDFFQAPKVDSFVEDLNRQEWVKYSVLDCPGRFTVRVASFRGPEVVTVAAKAKTNISNPSSALDRAANQAHKMTTSLRKRGVDAYEFHDRYGSYVMIGSFDSLGQEINGTFQYDPQIQSILAEFCGYREVTARDPTTGAVSRNLSLKSEDRIPFDIEGKATAVPRAQTSRIYSGSLFR